MVHPPSLDEFKRARNPKLTARLLAMRLTPHITGWTDSSVRLLLQRLN